MLDIHCIVDKAMGESCRLTELFKQIQVQVHNQFLPKGIVVFGLEAETEKFD